MNDSVPPAGGTPFLRSRLRRSGCSARSGGGRARAGRQPGQVSPGAPPPGPPPRPSPAAGASSPRLPLVAAVAQWSPRRPRPERPPRKMVAPESPPGLQRPQPPAGLPAPACQASAAPAGLQALARLPLQWRHPAQSHPQLQHVVILVNEENNNNNKPETRGAARDAKMDPIQKAVISHTFGVPSPLKKKLFISCNICHLRFNSANQAEAHYKGHKHARKLKAVEAAKSKQRPQTLARDGVLVSPTLTPASGSPGEPHSKAVPAAPPPGPQLQPPLTLDPTPREPAHSDLLDAASSSSSSSCPPCSPEPGREAPGPEPAVAAVGNGVNGEGRSEKGRLYCPTCKVTVNSASQLQAHNTGAKHRWMVEGQRGAPRRGRGRPVPRGGGHKAKRVAGGQGGRQGPSPPFHCALCQLQVNSETQLKQHLSSRRHKDRLAGKPPKTSSQHSKLQKHAALASKLALQKQLTKTLAARFLPSPIPAAAAAICALPGPLALRPAPTAATTLFPAPILGPALFRTPAGAVRPATGPIVFAPY
ncbi:zinc finger protein 385C isoform X3 [Leopardus geoffroyi]|uniref:zinc finger protein 385C isoform X3 n=1 Tax=Leopardus geoffroyi TaxID=46844 RepID=UPI001E2639E6|nr:zinc finger protein 385C isoform X3 [Leopardus geoffroyi]